MSTPLKRARGRLKARQRALSAAKAALKKATRAVTAAAQRVATTRRTVRRLKREEARGSQRAIREAAAHVGHTETPPGSNRSPLIDKFAAAFTPARAFPWCGSFVGWCLRQAGVAGLTDRVLYVPFIIADAQAGRNGFLEFVRPEHIRAGDLVCMDFGGSRDVGEHVGLAVEDYNTRLGSVETIEGNTSFAGQSGSQSNGGAIAERTRPRAVIIGGARPAYPR